MTVLVSLILAGGVIVDDLDAGCVRVGGWSASRRKKGCWARGYARHEKGRGEAYARWTPGVERGRWAVFARWVRGGATDAPFWISHADGLSRVRVDMSDETLAGRWNLLGVFGFSGDGLVEFVMLTNDADGLVVADAVMLTPAEQAERFKPVGEREELIGGWLDPLENWTVEGNVDFFHVSSRDGRVRIKTEKNGRGEGGFIWLKSELPPDFTFEFDFRPLSEAGFFQVFFCARGIDGRDIFAPEHEGVEEKRRARWFHKYTKGRIECYHLSYRRGKNRNCRLRKNPGLVELRTHAVEPIGKGSWHRLRLTKRGPRIRMVCDGELYLNYTDPSSLAGGRLGLRQVYESEGEYARMTLFSPGG